MSALDSATISDTTAHAVVVQCHYSPHRVVTRDRPWWGYPIGTKAPALGGGHWVKVKGGWVWHNGDIFPRPGADNTGKVILPPNDQAVATASTNLTPCDK